MELFDSHAHYNDEKFDEDREKIIKDTYEFGVTSFVCAGYSLASTKKAIEIAEKYQFIYATAGISPNDLTENWSDDVESIDKILSEKKVIAVGEIGLDYHYDTNLEWQKQAFIKQIELANKYDLPIVIHTRDAKNKGVFHCCPFNRELIKEALKLGFYISIAGPITFKNSKNAEEIANLVPIDRMLIETDSPYLAPEPVRGTRNDSRNVKYTAQKIADFRKTTIEEIAFPRELNAIWHEI